MAHSKQNPVMTLEAAAAWRDSLDKEGGRLVFTNGCFDLIHTGHVRYLAESRGLGDALLVALNSDVSVTAIKGPGRPVNGESDRAEVLAALRSVDGVVLFSEPRATRLIEEIRPHVYVKGGDYSVSSLNAEERAALDACGAEIKILPLVPGRSTTSTLKALEGEAPGTAKSIRIGVLGSGRGTNLTGILAAIGSGQLNAEVAVVLSDVADSGILKLAEQHRLPNAWVDPGNGRGLSDAAQKEFCDRLRGAAVDVVALCGFMRILKDPLLDEFGGRILNSHPSLLPKYPGRDAWKQAMNAGETETGCTIHLVDAGIDTGQVLAQEHVPILEGDTPAELHRRIQIAENALYPRAIRELAARRT